MRIQRVETRDGHVYEDRSFEAGLASSCHLCGQTIEYLDIEQVALSDNAPGPWMVRIQHIDAAAFDHLLPAENVANLTLR